MQGQPRPLFSIAGIPVSISVMHWVLIAFIGWGALKQSPALGFGVMLILSFSILWHELGHALVCKVFGLHPHIELMALGGLCHHRPVSRPRDKFLITAAGPAMNFLLAGVCWAALLVADGMLRDILFQGLWWNVVLGIFNLLPIFPLDGGVLTLIIARRIWRKGVKADRLVFSLGLGLSVILGLIGLFSSQMLLTFVMAYSAIDNWNALQAVGSDPVQHETKRHGTVRELLAKAHAAYDRGDYEDAMRLCHQAKAEPFLSIDEMKHVWQVLALSAARLSRWQDAQRYAERVQGSEEMAQVQAVCLLALKDPHKARVFLSSPAAELVGPRHLESLRGLARSAADAQA